MSLMMLIIILIIDNDDAMVYMCGANFQSVRRKSDKAASVQAHKYTVKPIFYSVFHMRKWRVG